MSVGLRVGCLIFDGCCSRLFGVYCKRDLLWDLGLGCRWVCLKFCIWFDVYLQGLFGFAYWVGVVRAWWIEFILGYV